MIIEELAMIDIKFELSLAREIMLLRCEGVFYKDMITKGLPIESKKRK